MCVVFLNCVTGAVADPLCACLPDPCAEAKGSLDSKNSCSDGLFSWQCDLVPAIEQRFGSALFAASEKRELFLDLSHRQCLGGRRPTLAALALADP
jgi:hypothetical protein